MPSAIDARNLQAFQQQLRRLANAGEPLSTPALVEALQSLELGELGPDANVDGKTKKRLESDLRKALKASGTSLPPGVNLADAVSSFLAEQGPGPGGQKRMSSGPLLTPPLPHSYLSESGDLNDLFGSQDASGDSSDDE